MKQNVLVITAFVLTFAAGALTGAFLVKQFAPQPFERWPEPPGMVLYGHGGRAMLDTTEWPGSPGMVFGPHRLDELQKYLNLDEAQRRKMEAVFDKYRAQIQKQIQQTRPPMLDQIEMMRHEIEQILTPEQREKLRAAALLFDRRLRFPMGRRPFERDSTFVPAPHLLLEE